jgi:hypothetical protein
MNRTNRFIASLFLTVALVAPVAVMAAAVPQEGVQVKVYDKSHKDYHNWDSNEDRAYTQFRASHKTYSVTFSKTTPKHRPPTGIGAMLIQIRTSRATASDVET